VKRIGLLAALVALVAAGAVLAALALAPRSEPTIAERTQMLAAELRCPDCQSLSVAESRTQAAAAIRTEIERQVAAGKSNELIRRYFVDSYGAWILLAPPDPLVWWLPALAIGAGIAALAAWFRFGRTRARAAPPSGEPVVADADRQRIHDELEALDG